MQNAGGRAGGGGVSILGHMHFGAVLTVYSDTLWPPLVNVLISIKMQIFTLGAQTWWLLNLPKAEAREESDGRAAYMYKKSRHACERRPRGLCWCWDQPAWPNTRVFCRLWLRFLPRFHEYGAISIASCATIVLQPYFAACHCHMNIEHTHCYCHIKKLSIF